MHQQIRSRKKKKILIQLENNDFTISKRHWVLLTVTTKNRDWLFKRWSNTRPTTWNSIKTLKRYCLTTDLWINGKGIHVTENAIQKTWHWPKDKRNRAKAKSPQYSYLNFLMNLNLAWWSCTRLQSVLQHCLAYHWPCTTMVPLRPATSHHNVITVSLLWNEAHPVQVKSPPQTMHLLKPK